MVFDPNKSDYLLPIQRVIFEALTTPNLCHDSYDPIVDEFTLRLIDALNKNIKITGKIEIMVGGVSVAEVNEISELKAFVAPFKPVY